jgi:hypothetical protein
MIFGSIRLGGGVRGECVAVVQVTGTRSRSFDDPAVAAKSLRGLDALAGDAVPDASAR